MTPSAYSPGAIFFWVTGAVWVAAGQAATVIAQGTSQAIQHVVAAGDTPKPMPDVVQWFLNNGLAVGVLMWLGIYVLLPIRDAAIKHLNAVGQSFVDLSEALRELKTVLHQDISTMDNKLNILIEQRFAEQKKDGDQ